MSDLIITNGYASKALPPGTIQLSVVDVAAIEPDALDDVLDQVLAGRQLIDQPEQVQYRFTAISAMSLAGTVAGCWLAALLMRFLLTTDTSPADVITRIDLWVWIVGVCGTGILIAKATQGTFHSREVLVRPVKAPVGLEVTITAKDRTVFPLRMRLQRLWSGPDACGAGVVVWFRCRGVGVGCAEPSLGPSRDAPHCQHNTHKVTCPEYRTSTLVDRFLPKVEEWVDRSHGKVRADRVHPSSPDGASIPPTTEPRRPSTAASPREKGPGSRSVRQNRPYPTPRLPIG